MVFKESDKKIKSMQWTILKSMFLTALLTVLSSLTILVVTQSSILNLQFFTSEVVFKFDTMLAIFTYVFTVITVALVITYIIGFSMTIDIKKHFIYINEVLLSLTRGRIDKRLRLGTYSELNNISGHFNNIAEGIQNQVESLQRLVEENQRIINSAEEAASLDERKKIARELHDSVSQQLFAISMTISAVKRLIDTNPPEAKKSFQSIEEMTHTAQQELRALIMHLRPINLNGVPLSEGLRKLLLELDQKNPNIKINWDIHPDIRVRPTGIEDHIFRVVQEALSNALRHSKATVLSLRLYGDDGLLTIFVEDNGIGFDVKIDKKSSYGISTMQERISEIGGRIDILSYPGKGTRIEIRIPLERRGGPSVGAKH